MEDAMKNKSMKQELESVEKRLEELDNLYVNKKEMSFSVWQDYYSLQLRRNNLQDWLRNDMTD